MKFIKYFLIFFLILTGCSSSKYPISRTAFALDTIIEIKIYQADKGVNADSVIDECIKLCSEYENKLSRTIETSEISKINNAFANEEIEVSSETAQLIKIALKYCELSNGALDITVAPVSSLWDFLSENPSIPSQDTINEGLSHINYKNIEINGNFIKKLDSKTALDLGAVAKGYIADRIKEYMEEKGITSAYISLGGNIVTIGVRPDKKPFNIGIQEPFNEQNSIIGSISSNDESIVTSGPYQRYFEYNEKIYHHILDPKTGYPTENELNSVTIRSKYSVDGDCLSTACFVLGLDEGIKLIESLDNIEAIFITNTGEIKYTTGITFNKKQ